MSNRFINAAFKTEMPQARKFVLVSLCDLADELTGEAYALIETIMARCCMSERGIQKQLADLSADGYLSRVFRRGRSTRYFVTDPSTWCTPQEMHPSTTCTTGVH